MDQTQFAGPATSSWLAGLNAAHGLDGLRDAMQDHTRALDVGNLQSLAIVGAAPEGRRLAQICRARGITIAAIVDDDPAKAGWSSRA